MISTENKRTVNTFLFFGLFAFFFASFITGIIKFPELQSYFLFVYNYIPAARLSNLHDFSGLILVSFIFVHLLMKRKHIGEYMAANFKISRKLALVLSLIIIFIVGAGISFAIYTSFFANKPISLSAVEIKDYQGEKLGSINDFRENSIKGPQYIDKISYKLEISGLVAAVKILNYDEILKLANYEKVVTLDCVEGWSVKALWSGFLVKDLLKDVDIKPEAKTIIFYAADGYSTSFPLDYVLNNDILMASRLNGVVLPAERGFPFQLIAEQKWGYKWIKWITKIELSSDTNYKGFWESRGYNNDGSLDGPKFAP